MRRYSAFAILFFAFAAGHGFAQYGTFSGRIVLEHATDSGHENKQDNSNVVVWLTPKNLSSAGHIPFRNTGPFSLTQKDKRFIPELLVVPVGSSIEFPNRDPFFHNVFSLFEGKRFDLGLYQAGETRSVRFDREGVSYVFCNIHPEMHAVVMALASPFFAVTDKRGSFAIHNAPAGEYTLRVWSERALPNSLQKLEQTVRVSGRDFILPTLHLEEARLVAEHKNKFGKDYDRTPPTPIY
jgi:plastocyanin